MNAVQVMALIDEAGTLRRCKGALGLRWPGDAQAGGRLGIHWRDSSNVLAGLLRGRGEDPDRVTDVEAAWQAFQAFLAVTVDGLEPEPDSDADGFIVQWGRNTWNDGQPSLTFTRQMAVDVRASWTEKPDWYQPEYWQVNLVMIFPDTPELADLDRLGRSGTDYDFSPPGPAQTDAFREAEAVIQQYPTLQAMWAAVPARSELYLDHTC